MFDFFFSICDDDYMKVYQSVEARMGDFMTHQIFRYVNTDSYSNCFKLALECS